MSAQPTPYDRKVLVDVLVYHWPTRNSGCHCGWSRLGASFPEHVADIYEASALARREAHPAHGAENDCCADCRLPYAGWYADSDLWNVVMRPPGWTGAEPFLCASCFLLRAQAVTDMARVTWSDVPSRLDREQGRISPVRGYMVLLHEYGHWSDNWDGALHPTLAEAREQRDEARREGHVACVIQALDIPDANPWTGDAAPVEVPGA